MVVGIVIERSRRLRHASLRPKPLLDGIREDVVAGRFGAALERASAVRGTAFGDVIRTGLMCASQPLESVRAAVYTSALEQVQGLSKRLSTLTALGVIALLWGILAAFFELLPAFVNVADAPIGARSARIVDEAGFAFGPTGLGMMVAVVALLARALLGSWVRKLEAQLDYGATAFLNLLRKDAPSPEHPYRGET